MTRFAITNSASIYLERVEHDVLQCNSDQYLLGMSS